MSVSWDSPPYRTSSAEMDRRVHCVTLDPRPVGCHERLGKSEVTAAFRELDPGAKLDVVDQRLERRIVLLTRLGEERGQPVEVPLPELARENVRLQLLKFVQQGIGPLDDPLARLQRIL